MTTLSFDVVHTYPDNEDGIELSVMLKAGSHETRLQAKVDTGATYCIFERAYAEALGIEVESGIPMRISTATGAFEAYGHEVTLECLSWEIPCVAYFAGNESFGRNVLGRHGWLQQFRVAIVDYDSKIYLAKYDA